jgi:hypothetical protein
MYVHLVEVNQEETIREKTVKKRNIWENVG